MLLFEVAGPHDKGLLEPPQKRVQVCLEILLVSENQVVLVDRLSRRLVLKSAVLPVDRLVVSAHLLLVPLRKVDLRYVRV